MGFHIHALPLNDAIGQSTERLRNRLFAGAYPSSLHHYTSAANVTSIVESRSIWATSLADQQDKTELSHAISLVAEQAEELIRFGTSTFATDVLRQTAFMMEERKEWFFIACFCGDNESAFHFRRYGRYCLTVTAPFGGAPSLSHTDQNSDWWYQRVIYDVDQQNGGIRQALASVVKPISLYTGGTNDGPWKAAMVESCARIVANHLLAVAVGFKRPEFSEDREWRFVCCPKLNPLHSAPRMLDEQFATAIKRNVRRHIVLTVPRNSTSYAPLRIPPVPFTKITAWKQGEEVSAEIGLIRNSLDKAGEGRLAEYL